jgi:hypothetical protein
MTYDDFAEHVARKGMYETIYTDSEGREILVIRLLDAYGLVRPWVGLTEQEHTEIAIECGCLSADWVMYGATVERKLKEKNQ